MGTLFEGFQILYTDYDYILGKKGDSIPGRTLYKGGHYSRKYSTFEGVPEKNTNKIVAVVLHERQTGPIT